MPSPQRRTAVIAWAALSPWTACNRSAPPSAVEGTQPHEGLRVSPSDVAPTELDCRGSAFPACPRGTAGRQCDLDCTPGFDQCEVHYYCHADGRVLGLRAAGTYLFPHTSPDHEPRQVRDDLEQWISAHEVDLGFPDGLSRDSLRIEVTENAEAAQGLLTIHRLHQYYDASGQTALVVGDGSMITVEANAFGVLAVKGTIIDPRVAYAHSASQAGSQQAKASIQHHVAVREAVTAQDVEILDLGVVAVPGANVIGWQGVAGINGQISSATVIVAAVPHVTGLLPLVQYQDHTANGLTNTVEIDVISENLGSDINSLPISEATVSSLFNGAALLGSIDDISMDPQLATEAVVTLDLHGGELEDVLGPADFDRFTGATGDFDVTQPSLGFDAQRYHHLAMETYALVDHVTAGAWDSALPRFTKPVPDPMNPMNTIEIPRTTDHPPGQFRPRILNATNHPSLGGPTGQATYAHIRNLNPIPELFQQPGPAQESEVIAYIRLPPGSAPAHVFFHELGHAVDTFMAPGYAKNFIPSCMVGCDDTCDEDTSDEALPLTETIAQLFALWQYQRIAGIPHDDCGIIAAIMTGAGQGSTLVHHPSCMDDLDQISMFIRPDDPACTDSDFCDKPSVNEVEADVGPPYVCDATEGYNVTSMLQVWWNALHGQYCEPTHPFTCSTILGVAWPPGCDAPGSTTACATADEVVGLALVYATRTNPLTYADFLDALAGFVACNYGGDAYLEFNQGLCDHQLRECDEQLPIICQSCGNGLREGTEDCDGLDLSVPELGVVPTCQDFGYTDGTLLCDMSCAYDFSQCTLTGTTNEELDSTATADGPSADSSSENSGSSGTAGAGGGGGCQCSTDGSRTTPWLLASVVGVGARRRRRRRQSAPLPMWRISAAGLVGLATMLVIESGCSPSCESEATTVGDSSSGTMTASDTSSTDPSTAEPPAAWPMHFYGAFCTNTDMLGIPGMYVAALDNLELTEAGLHVTHLSCSGDDLTEEYFVDYEGAEAHVRPLPGETHVMWRGGPAARELVFRPGATCDVLETELIDPFPGYEELWRWRRGALVITDSCAGVNDDVWAVDLSPDVPTECPPAG
jgi:MYXO-CTERM domain-containing protein